jgi:CheY-like chemotaxis protein
LRHVSSSIERCVGMPVRSLPFFAMTVGVPAACMVVDDDRLSRLVIQHQLAMLGISAFTAVSCRDALQQSALHHPGIVFLDTCLPDGDGYQLARSLTSQSADASRPAPQLISLSARAGEAHERCCAAAGIGTILPKPVSSARLAEAVGLEPRIGGGGSADLDAPEPAVSPGASGKLIDLYRSACLKDIQDLRLAIECGDRDRARAFAHRLRGASACVGAGVVSAIAAVFETAEGACPPEPCIQDAALRWLERIFSSAGFASSIGVP